MKTLNRFWLVVVATLAILIVGATFLPHSQYIRYQLLDVGTYKKAKWIYERTHFNDTPIDIAFFGTSHTLNGVDSELVEKSLNQFSGKNKHVVNFSSPHLGRDMHYTLMKMLLDEHSPEVVVLEVRESEARDLHPGTHYLAESSDLLLAPLMVNLRYFGNLIRQPGRNLKALLHQIAAPLGGHPASASASLPIENHNNMALSNPNGEERAALLSHEELARQRKSELKYAPYKYNQLPWWETFLYFNANSHYVGLMQELAEKKNIKLLYLYLPDYGTNRLPYRNIYSSGDRWLLHPDMDFYQRNDIWSDLGHLNKTGATYMSEYVGAALVNCIDGANSSCPLPRKL